MIKTRDSNSNLLATLLAFSTFLQASITLAPRLARSLAVSSPIPAKLGNMKIKNRILPKYILII